MIDDTKQATRSATTDPEPEPEVAAIEEPTVAAGTDAGPTTDDDQAAVAQADGSASATESASPADLVRQPEADEASPEIASAGNGLAVSTDVEATEPLHVGPEDLEPGSVADEPPLADEAAASEAAPVADQPQVADESEASDEAQVATEAPAAPYEPTTMAELMENPDNEVKSLKHGDVVEGTVVRIDPDEILVDFGGKSEGVVSNRELISRRGPRDGDDNRPELNVGDEVLVYVLQPESPEGHAVLSLRRAGLERKWRGMQERFDAGEIVEARVIDHNKGGLIVDLGVRGFVPISQIVDFPRRPRDEQPRDAAQEIAEKLQPFVGRTLRLKILEVNRKANRLILSEKVALYEERREKRDELFSSLQVGQRVTGVVRSIAPFGVFVDLGGIDGLVHKSELSWNKVNNPESAHNMGDEVEAEVIDINHERGRISLSIRRLQADPWQESVAKYKIGDVIDGTVTKLVNFGAFVRVEEGLEGLIHISELSNQRVAHPGDVVQEGQQVKLRIISLDSERHRLGLSLKQAEDRPAPAPREERPRRERTSSRRDQPNYRPEDATAEPEGGIDSTMAAAFASSGFLDQLRASEDEGGQESAAPAATEEPKADTTAEARADETEEPKADTTAEARTDETEEREPEAVPDATAVADEQRGEDLPETPAEPLNDDDRRPSADEPKADDVATAEDPAKT